VLNVKGEFTWRRKRDRMDKITFYHIEESVNNSAIETIQPAQFSFSTAFAAAEIKYTAL
jgi:hypothetical protein